MAKTIKIITDPFKINKISYIEKLERVYQFLNLRGQITIKLGDKRESRDLNFRHRQKDKVTDVLSFSIQEEFPDGFYLGDIFICYPLALEQAKENHTHPDEELLLLMIHGILHLAGYDHEKDSGQMQRVQQQLLQQVNQPPRSTNG